MHECKNANLNDNETEQKVLTQEHTNASVLKKAGPQIWPSTGLQIRFH